MADEHPMEQDGSGRDTGKNACNPFLGSPAFDRKPLFSSDRLPNVLVTKRGTLIAIWGEFQCTPGHRLRVRRSEDGGRTWATEQAISEGEHGGGALIDETTGHILVFAERDTRSENPERVLVVSTDDGRTWQESAASFEADGEGNDPRLHMAEHGITLEHGSHTGRLLRPARVYGADGYNTALYSDDGGNTWIPSEPFPIRGTGEGAVAELRDGRIYYSSRRHYFPAGESMQAGRMYAWSHDGGETWTDPGVDATIPDGPRHRSATGRGACYNGHFGMMGGLARVPLADTDILLYSTADNEGYFRRGMTVWASFDGGRSWPVKRRVYDRPSAYSSLAVGRPATPTAGWIYLLFEHGVPRSTDDWPRIDYTGGTISRFNLRWLARGERTGSG